MTNDIPNDIPLRAYQIASCPREWTIRGQTGSRIADGLNKELADYIVRACNSYASDQEKIKDLLAACKAAYQDVELQNVPGGSNELSIMVEAAISEAEKVLAKESAK